MIRAGVPQSVAMTISGHRTIAMFLRYGITSDEDKRKALLNVQAFARVDRAERKALAFASEPELAESPPTAKTRTKTRTKMKNGSDPDGPTH